VRNVGTGIAVLHGWNLSPRAKLSGANPDHAPLEEFQRHWNIDRPDPRSLASAAERHGAGAPAGLQNR
jgi:hypothetical protein